MRGSGVHEGGAHLEGGFAVCDVPEAVAGEHHDSRRARLQADHVADVGHRAEPQVLVLQELVAQAARQVEPIQPRALCPHADAHACNANAHSTQPTCPQLLFEAPLSLWNLCAKQKPE